MDVAEFIKSSPFNLKRSNFFDELTGLFVFLDFIFELFDHERRSPHHVSLAPNDIAVEVVSNIKNLISSVAKGLLELFRISAHKETALFDGLYPASRGDSSIVEFYQRLIAAPEVWLVGPDNDRIKICSPVRITVFTIAQEEAHDIVCVVPH